MHDYDKDILGFHDAFVTEMAGQPLYRVLGTGAGRSVAADREATSTVRLVEDIRAGWPDMSVEFPDLDDLTGDRFDGIVNATPMGMARYQGMLVPRDPRAALWVSHTSRQP
ncbi:hypothetical protein [Nisaea denitrificans]|uniref:hypothetical protein n=1 Tax=Nisaea denitrificans TaxID=390877 RepID=UPI00040DD3FD|nr:hypothetical protein [Nisaea denitrificans]